MINLALISPDENAYSETFIRRHKELLRTNTFFLFNGLIPIQSEDGQLHVKLTLYNRLRRKLSKLFFPFLFNFHDRALIWYFRQNNIQAVLTEYGLTGVEMMKLCEHLNLPLIVHFHGYDAYQTAVLNAYAKRYRKLFKQAFKIIAVSKHMVLQLVNLGCPAQKIVLNPYGPSDMFFSVSTDHASNLFVAIGRFVEKKAPHVTIQAFKRVVDLHPEARLIMVGSGPLIEDCKKLVDSLHLSNHVEFSGVLNSGQIRDIFSEALAFVQHSVTATNGDMEGTPVSVLEASAAGLPVIATKHAGISDVVIDGKTGFLVEENDMEGMAENMMKVLQDKALAGRMGLCGRERIRKHFSLEKHLTALDAIIVEATAPLSFADEYQAASTF